MAEFEVKIVQVDKVIEHPNADRLTIVKIGGYNCIANKKEDGSWRYQSGDLVVYIPEGALLQEWLLRHLNMWNEEKNKGYLAGSAGNRVKAINLRGVVSQGVLLPVTIEDAFLVDGKSWYISDVQTEAERMAIAEGNTIDKVKTKTLGIDVSDILGIIKYEPVIPSSMNGEVENGTGMTLSYDIENMQKYPTVIKEGEEVVITEQLHGTWACYGLWPTDNSFKHIITSKGLSSKGLIFKLTEENLIKNVYFRAHSGTIDLNDEYLTQRLMSWMKNTNITEPVYLLGEVYGKGIQDLSYSTERPLFRLFDIYIGEPGKGRYVNYDDMVTIANLISVDTVPLLYRGLFSEDVAKEHRDGKTVLGGKNIREGVVITPIKERRDTMLGRVKLKLVSPDYLLRKNATEYN